MELERHLHRSAARLGGGLAGMQRGRDDLVSPAVEGVGDRQRPLDATAGDIEALEVGTLAQQLPGQLVIDGVGYRFELDACKRCGAGRRTALRPSAARRPATG
ncbi:hypothetical protein [Leptothrix discophora]|uniref:Uncharacterized protein n=1 Tax=Leptothrix discophora TaxID=89 RepID=A0ABT9G0K8_LEPDI|nr:hypothetical protein [Leptothrix discophora]MDP4300013.1 hypothetical protein [Leptothrix discophora]